MSLAPSIHTFSRQRDHDVAERATADLKDEQNLADMVSLVAQLNATGDSAAFLAGEKDAALEVDVNAQVNSWIACAAPAAHSTAPIDRHAAGSSTRRP